MKDKVIIITGAAGGIGSAIARKFSSAGASLVLADISKERLDVLLETLGVEHLAVPSDVTNIDDIKGLIDKALRHKGKIDVMINNAGIIRPNYIDDSPYGDIRDQIEVNLFSVIAGSKEVIPVMKRQGFGHIVNICSLGGIVPEAGSSVYTATKFGVRGFSLTLDLELKKYGINVSIINPDSVETPMLEYEAKCGVSGVAFANKPLVPEDVADAVFRAVTNKKLEVCVPYSEGIMARLALTIPWIFRYILPLYEKKGMKNLSRRRSQ